MPLPTGFVSRQIDMSASKGKRRALATGLVLLVVATFVIASMVELSDTRSSVARWVDDEADLVQEDVTEAIDTVLADLESVAAFVEGGHPTSSSFATFVQQIDGTAHAIGIGYTPVVLAQDLDAFISDQRAIHGAGYEIFSLNPDGSPAPLDRTGRLIFFPVEFFAVGDLMAPPAAAEEDPTFGRGMDAGYNESWRAESTRAVAVEGPALSHFISVDIDVVSLDRVFIASVPVRAQDGSTVGLVQALMLEQLLLPEVQGHALDSVDWEVVPDRTSPTRLDPEVAQVYPLELPGVTWSLAIAPTDESLAKLRGLPWWVTGLTAASVVFFAALALWLFIDWRSEHRRVARFEQLAADKDRFVASVSHELRTPLTVVAGLAYELNDQPETFSSEERDGLMSMLVEQTDELSGIVEDLLIAARSDIGMVAIHHSNVDLGAEAERAMATAGITGTTRGISGHAFADPQRVRQILRNLLTNAKRYGGPRIRIDLADGAGWTEVVVADNGEGVPREKRELIFQSYESAHDPSSKVESVGLGLYISRTLARAMGGDLEYVYDGTWSHFRLRLPSAPARPDRPDDSVVDKVERDPIGIL
jgi:signal transduction histidine kinase